MTLIGIPSELNESNARDLFEEAHRRRHRRRLAAVSASIIVLVVGLVLAVVLGGGSTVAPLPTTSPNFATVVTNATRSSGSAHVVVTTRHSEPGCPSAQSVATGTIDFASHSMATAVSSRSAYNLCTDPTGTQQRQFGNVVYQTVSTPSCGPKPCHVVVSGGSAAEAPGRWIRSVNSTALPRFGGGSTAKVVDSPYALLLLRAISGPVHRGAVTTVDGSRVTRYTAVVSLADLQRVVRAAGGRTADALSQVLSLPGSLPSSSAITVRVQVWVNSADGVVQMTVSQPIFVVNFVGGASEGGIQFPPGYGERGQVPSDRPYVRGSFAVTVAFSNFGTSSVVIPPPRNLVSNSE